MVKRRVKRRSGMKRRPTSSVWGVMKSIKGSPNRPTRLVRASVVDIRTSISSIGLPRTLVDCVGVTDRQPIPAAVVLGSSGMLWQANRQPLKPTTRNLVTGTQYSDNAVDRMAEMVHDINSTGWDGDEVCIGFIGREAVVLGAFGHRLAWIDLEPNELEDLEPGRRLQDDSDWDVTNIGDGRDTLEVAFNNSHPDAMVSRWGRYVQTFWETRGGVGEVRRPNNEEGKEGTYYQSHHAQWEFSAEWVRAQAHQVRIASLEKDTFGDEDKNLIPRNILVLNDGSESSYSIPEDEDLVDGFLGIVNFSTLAFSATDVSGGGETTDELASATRWPEISDYVLALKNQVAELSFQNEFIRDTLIQLIGAVATITTVVPGLAALQSSGINPGEILSTLTPKQPEPELDVLLASQSKVFRVGK